MGTLEQLEAQADVVEQHGLDTLLYCPDAWALRHRFIHQETGEVRRARCNRWDCLFCGPRKVDLWRQLIALAEPTLFVTLSSVGLTVEEAARVLTTFLQYLRRGSKGRGKDHDGARPAYPVECLSVLEEHRKKETGFHWHILMKGVDYIPQKVLSEALESATHGRVKIVYVRRIENARAIGYVTKYLTKDVTTGRRGHRHAQRTQTVPAMAASEGVANEQGNSYLYEMCCDEQGHIVEQEQVEVVEQESRARRIRYTRRFFPATTAELRHRLFAQLDGAGNIAIDAGANEVTVEDDQQSEKQVKEVCEENEQDAGVKDGTEEGKRSLWMLVEHEEFTREREEYQRRRRRALLASLADLHDGKLMYSRRVISAWDYQRKRQQGRRVA